MSNTNGTEKPRYTAFQMEVISRLAVIETRQKDLLEQVSKINGSVAAHERYIQRTEGSIRAVKYVAGAVSLVVSGLSIFAQRLFR